jgi:UPF0176 protein
VSEEPVVAGVSALDSAAEACCFFAVPAVTNISTYRFAELTGLKELRAELVDRCREWELKGTILLSTEGINLFVAGAAGSIDLLLKRLREIPGLEGLEPKVSVSETQPFNRMLVRIKKEIISFGVEGVRPALHTSPKLPARELKRWLDEGRKVTLLDTRNDYEVKLGTFKGALVPGIDTFREFPDAVRKLPESLKDEPVVMFCTGGIRCEKAGPFMEMEGFRQIYQLDGGILKYFEEVGGDHYEGECFVFDQRVGLDPALRETETAVCFACQAPLDAAEREDPRHVEGVSCPHCFKGEPEKMAERIALREEALRRVTTPLPGSVPRENRRPIHVPGSHDGWTLGELLVAIFPQIGEEEWKERCAAGRFVAEDEQVLGWDRVLRAGERVMQIFPLECEPPVSAEVKVVHEDESLFVIHKPAPLPMHPSGRFHHNTLQHFLRLAYAPEVPRPLHRLDANTTGLVLFARTRHFCRQLQRQFLEGTVEKEYLVRAAGHPGEEEFTARFAIGDVPGPLGSREIDEEDGRPAETIFRVLRRLDDGTALLSARLTTGRTHQIRLHLQHLGWPVCGDPAYLAGGGTGTTQTLDPEDPPLQLHAWRLAFQHPLSGERMEFQTAPPEWAAAAFGGLCATAAAQ